MRAVDLTKIRDVYKGLSNIEFFFKVNSDYPKLILTLLLFFERNSEIKISFLIKAKDTTENKDKRLRSKKIGQSILIVQKMGRENKLHTAMIKLRHTVRMGFENASPFQYSIFNFLETAFKMTYIFSITDEQIPDNKKVTNFSPS